MESVRDLFGNGLCTSTTVGVTDGQGPSPSQVGRACSTDKDCTGKGEACTAFGTVVVGYQNPPPPTAAGMEVAVVTAVQYDAGTIRQGQGQGQGWSFHTAGGVGAVVSRLPGINVVYQDVRLDQAAYTANAFSYSRPVVRLVTPRSGPVRTQRTITIDGSDFGFKTMYRSRTEPPSCQSFRLFVLLWGTDLFWYLHTLTP